jgi:hypothetical protein
VSLLCYYHNFRSSLTTRFHNSKGCSIKRKGNIYSHIQKINKFKTKNSRFFLTIFFSNRLKLVIDFTAFTETENKITHYNNNTLISEHTHTSCNKDCPLYRFNQVLIKVSLKKNEIILKKCATWTTRCWLFFFYVDVGGGARDIFMCG